MAYGVLFAPLPYPDAGRLAAVVQVGLEDGGGFPELRPTDLLDVRLRSRTFESVVAGEPFGHTLDDDDPEILTSWLVSRGFFDAIGVEPVLGRVFDEADHREGRVVVLSHGLWVRRFGADSGVVGRTVRLSGESFVVVGVMGYMHRPCSRNESDLACGYG